MFKRAFRTENKSKDKVEKDQLKQELESMLKTTKIVFRKLEKKIEILKNMELSIDKKIAAFERLINITGSFENPSININRQHEIIKLSSKGIKVDEVANILDIPKGEVELVLNLGR